MLEPEGSPAGGERAQGAEAWSMALPVCLRKIFSCGGPVGRGDQIPESCVCWAEEPDPAVSLGAS